MSEEDKELFIKQLMLNQQLLKAIIILMCPTQEDGIKIFNECKNNIDIAFDAIKKKQEVENNEIQTN